MECAIFVDDTYEMPAPCFFLTDYDDESGAKFLTQVRFVLRPVAKLGRWGILEVRVVEDD
jgi:hypothetical protein